MTRWLGSTWVRAAITVAILAYLLRQVDGRAALEAMLRADPRALAVVAGLVLLDRVVMIWRWVLLLRSSGTAIATRRWWRGRGRVAVVGGVLAMTALSVLVPVGFFGDARFKVASAPLLALVAGIGIDRVSRVVRARSGRPAHPRPTTP